MRQATSERAWWERTTCAGAVAAAAFAMAACSTVNPPAVEPPPVAVPPVPEDAMPEAPAEEAPRLAASKPAPPPRRSVLPPDAKPKVERIAHGPPNHPYSINGVRYTPYDTDLPMSEIGVASWYGQPFHGRPAATGERYDMDGMTAAHPTMPLPSYARVRNLKNGREVIVRVNDRGPFVPGRIIDLSRSAARRLGFSGLAMVEVTRLTHDDIRSGAWREPRRAAMPSAAVATPPLAAKAQSAAPAITPTPARTTLASTR